MAQGVRTPFITARSFLLFCFLRHSLSLLNVVSFPGQIQWAVFLYIYHVCETAAQTGKKTWKGLNSLRETTYINHYIPFFSTHASRQLFNTICPLAHCSYFCWDGVLKGKKKRSELKYRKYDKNKVKSGSVEGWNGGKKIKGGREERWDRWMWRKLLGAALLWQANWSSVWQQTLSCHSSEEPICFILQAVCWILMMFQRAQTTLTLRHPPKHLGYTSSPSPKTICNRVRGILHTGSDCSTCELCGCDNFVNLSGRLIHDNVILDSAGRFPLLIRWDYAFRHNT